MKKLVAILLAVVGAVMIYQGVARRNSLVGEAATMGTKVANKFDGGARTPEHVFYIAGGALLVVVGVVIALRGRD